ncbi:MAG: hypothetical protein HYZ53_09475 [Planctomycetes bacterium]|nr:hypothetical protein [Planctomycetota bacterium]
MGRPDTDGDDPGTRPGAAPSGWVRKTITATLLEDAHPGSGAGGGGIDALVSRDREGAPVIWATHLEGLLRDASRALHEGEQHANNLFGKRGRTRQQAVFTSLYWNDTAALGTPPASRVWRSSARESFVNRAPKDETLRAVEFVPKNTTFVGEVELPSSVVTEVDRLLQEVDAVGRGRASGAGRVRMKLGDAKVPSRPVNKPDARLLLLLRNHDPVCVASTATPGNLILTLPYLPGRTVAGALAAWLISEGNREAALGLMDGSLSVGDALPVPEPGKDGRLCSIEVLPAPLALQSAKPAKSIGSAPWWAYVEPPPIRFNAAGHKGDKLKRPEPDLFVNRAGKGPWSTLRPDIRVRLRNGRPDPKQPDPLLFAIEQVSERTNFLAEIRGDPTKLCALGEALAPVLEGRRWIRVGRSGAPVEVERAEWAKAPEPATVREIAYLTLTADLLVRDARLRWLTELDAKTISSSTVPGWVADVTATPLYQDETSVYGFNGTAGLWRLPAAGVRRGSVFKVAGNGIEILARAAADGKWLGERTHEGFGRFRLDPTLPGISADTPTGGTAAVLRTGVAPDPGEAVALKTQGWFEAHRGLARPGTSGERRPSLSQWQNLAAELAGENTEALSSRRNPQTAGLAAWRHPDATAILDELERVGPGHAAAHANFFVRWLRAEARKEAK